MNPNLAMTLGAFYEAADRVTVLRAHHKSTLGDRRGIETPEFKKAQSDMYAIMREIEEMLIEGHPYCECCRRLC